MTIRGRWLMASVAGLMFVGSASFETAIASAQTAPATGTDVKAGTVVSPTDQSTLSDQYVAKMQTSSTRVRHLLDEARRQKDVVKTTCLSDKLAQIEVATRSARERQTALKAAIARGDTDIRNHEFAVLSVLRQRAEQLDAEANQCVGEELGFPGETKITYAIDPNIASVDPTVAPGDGVIYVPPLPVSTFQ